MSAELIAQRKRLVDEWNAWRIKAKDEILGERKLGKRAKTQQQVEEEEKEEIEVWIDEVIEQVEEEVIE